MREEDFIRNKCGTNNPFRTPEGYFENFTDSLMARLPEREADVRSMKHRPTSIHRHMAWFAAAAAVLGIMVCGGLYLTHQNTMEHETAYVLNTGETTDAYIEEALDYAMVSNHEIAQYLTEAY